MIICIYDVTEYGSCMIDDVLFDMLDDYNFDMLYDYSFEMIFWNYFHSLKKGLCWPSVREYFHFEFGSAQSLKAIFYAPRFEMIYDFHLQMSRKICVHKIIFVRNSWRNLLTKIHRFLSFSYRKIYFLFNNCSVFLSRLSMLNWKDGQLLLTARFKKVNVN